MPLRAPQCDRSCWEQVPAAKLKVPAPPILRPDDERVNLGVFRCHAPLASISYGLLFATEGVGLWLEKRWAEYLTIIATGSFIPFELYELVRKLTAVRTGALVTNTFAVAYLVYRLRHPVNVRQELR